METRRCCNVHVGPHWLYMDFLDRERNLAYLERAIRCAETGSWRQFEFALHAYMQEDQARLSEKRCNMERENTFVHNGESKEYPYSLLDIDERVERFEQRRRALLERLERVCFPSVIPTRVG